MSGGEVMGSRIHASCEFLVPIVRFLENSYSWKFSKNGRFPCLQFPWWPDAWVAFCLFSTVFHSMHESREGTSVWLLLGHWETVFCLTEICAKQRLHVGKKKKWPQYFTASPMKKQCLFVHPRDLGLATWSQTRGGHSRLAKLLPSWPRPGDFSADQKNHEKF